MKKTLVLAFAVLAGAAFAQSEFVGFETSEGYAGSPGGIDLAGQNGWYLPAGITTTVRTYVDHPFLSNANPHGGEQLQTGIYNANFGRSQKDFAWNPTKSYSFGFEQSFKFIGEAGFQISNIQSISTQTNSANQSIILTAYWGDETNPDKAACYDVLANDVAALTYYPIMEDQTIDPTATYNDGLESDHWYARYQLMDLVANKVSISCIVDLENYRHFSREYDATSGFLFPNMGDVPTAYRLFTGGGTGTETTIGNLSAADNCAIISNDVTVSGTMVHNGTDNNPICQRVEFYDPNTQALVGHSLAAISNGDGTYSVNAPGMGMYCMSVKHSHWLRQTRMIDTTLGSISDVSFSLINGDCDGDNEVNLVDAGIIAATFGKAVGDEGFDPMADLDDDGEITLVDNGIMSSNFGQEGDSECL